MQRGIAEPKGAQINAKPATALLLLYSKKTLAKYNEFIEELRASFNQLYFHSLPRNFYSIKIIFKGPLSSLNILYL